MSAQPVTERMAEARVRMVTERKRVPRVYFLSPDDFAAFEATRPPTVEAMFALPLGHKPSPMTCLGFDGLPVRRTTAKPNRSGKIGSRLISCCGISVFLRDE